MATRKNIYEIMASGNLEQFVEEHMKQLFSDGVTDLKTVYLKGLMDGYKLAVEKDLKK